MRVQEIITEAAYDGILGRLMKKYPRWAEYLQGQTEWARRALSKPDRIIWWLKLVERQLDSVLVANPQATNLGSVLTGYRNSLDHLMNIQYPPIQNFVFGANTPQLIIAELNRLEQKYLELSKVEKSVNMMSGDKVVHDFGNGLKWIYTDRAYCPDEGRSGKHCGNVAGQVKTDQRILSLRKNGHVRLTFILEPDGFLGEMKAKGNQKPSEQYHPYIIWLLEQPFIKGLRGGGALARNNFDLNQLSPDDREALSRKRPTLADWGKITSAVKVNAASLDISNEGSIDGILDAITEFVVDDLNNAVARNAEEQEIDVDDALGSLEEAVDYQFASDVVLDVGDVVGLTLADIPNRLASLVSDWNGTVKLDEFRDVISEVFAKVRVQYHLDASGLDGNWSVTYKGRTATGYLQHNEHVEA